MKTLPAVLLALAIGALAPLATAAPAARSAAPAAGVPKGGPAARIKRLDTNGDGRISAAEFAARPRAAAKPHAKAFARLDANHDGYLEPGELRAGARAHIRREAARRPAAAARGQTRAQRVAKRAARG